ITPKTQQTTAKDTMPGPPFERAGGWNLPMALTDPQASGSLQTSRRQRRAAPGRTSRRPEPHSRPRVASQAANATAMAAGRLLRNEAPMATRQHGRIVETPTEARQS